MSFERVLQISRDAGYGSGTAWSLFNLADIAVDRHDHSAARMGYLEALVLFEKEGNRTAMTHCLEGLAGVAAGENQERRAAWLFGAAEVLREALAVRHKPADRRAYDLQVTRLRAAMGKADFVQAWTRGRCAPLAEVLAHASTEGLPDP
jgi:hypothetical protein